MMVEMLVRRVVDGRVQFSVELVDTYNGDTECVTLTRPPARLTALVVASSSPASRNSSTTEVPTVVVDASCRLKNMRT